LTAYIHRVGFRLGYLISQFRFKSTLPNVSVAGVVALTFKYMLARSDEFFKV
jgi:hypothetical protein